MKTACVLLLIVATASAQLTLELSPDFLASIEAAKTHYGDPKAGCESDEIKIQIANVAGDVCAPSCGLLTKCPTDSPAGVTAKPQCALQNSGTGKKYCALICSASKADDAQCGGATCRTVQGSIGICTYATSAAELAAELAAEPLVSDLAGFAAWKAEMGKEYESFGEEARRFGIWADNKLVVAEHNAAGHAWSMAMNRFADQTAEEFGAWALGVKGDTTRRSGTPQVAEVSLRGADAPPPSVDWRTKGVVNPVKNQEQCGSCWAFSTIASFETQYALKHNLTSFSEQDLVDCVKGVSGCCSGCQGGLMDAAFTYMVATQSGGDDTEAKYPYLQKTGTCAFASDGPAFGGIQSHTDIPAGNEAALQKAVASVGVISVGVDASKGWQMYSKGVYTPILPGIIGCNNKPGTMDHGVAIVGYNSEGGKDYWIVRNSWGASWGNAGYMYLNRAKNACGVQNAASFPVLK